MQCYRTWVCALVAMSCVYFLHYAVSLKSIYLLTYLPVATISMANYVICFTTLHSPPPLHSHHIQLHPFNLPVNLLPVILLHLKPISISLPHPA
ncbi:hypothetical protein R3P38DRAFT_2935992 [Favolaschia claudopus]|uniref:Secreted peptide n=1 Tax=Favolaschia claudopus TaxID=2862362 RepID=A0AAW0BP36_9AGAR